MLEALPILLRLAGLGLILLVILHVPIHKRLDWAAEASRMSRLNAAIFHSHTIFLCLVLLATGLPCLLDPQVLLEPSRAALWASWSLTLFWSLRLCFQWFFYKPSWWRGQPFELSMHWFFSGFWLFLVVTFGLCALHQSGFLSLAP